MEYILLAGIIISLVINFFISKYFANRISLSQSKLLSEYRKEMLSFTLTQKNNTEKLVELLNRLFLTSEPQQSKPEPNEVSKVNKDEIDFTEQNPINLPADIKFEVEGGDTFIPPGYEERGGQA